MAEMLFRAPGIYDGEIHCNRCEQTHYSMSICKGWQRHQVKTDDLPGFLAENLGLSADETFRLVEESRIKQRVRFGKRHPKHQTPTGDPIRFWEASRRWDISGSGIDYWRVWIED
jgi:hypothetical protein